VREQYGAEGPPSDGPADHRFVVNIDPSRINTNPQ
jgi:hypothetical protein